MSLLSPTISMQLQELQLPMLQVLCLAHSAASRLRTSLSNINLHCKCFERWRMPLGGGCAPKLGPQLPQTRARRCSNKRAHWGTCKHSQSRASTGKHAEAHSVSSNRTQLLTGTRKPTHTHLVIEGHLECRVRHVLQQLRGVALQQAGEASIPPNPTSCCPDRRYVL